MWTRGCERLDAFVVAEIAHGLPFGTDSVSAGMRGDPFRENTCLAKRGISSPLTLVSTRATHLSGKEQVFSFPKTCECIPACAVLTPDYLRAAFAAR